METHETCCECVDELKNQIERLKHELLVIGDLAVTDWNDPVVGRVDSVVPNVPVTYADVRRAELTEIASLRAKLGEAQAEIERFKTSAVDLAEITHRQQAEIEQRKAELEGWKSRNVYPAEYREALEEIATLRAQLADARQLARACLATNRERKP